MASASVSGKWVGSYHYTRPPSLWSSQSFREVSFTLHLSQSERGEISGTCWDDPPHGPREVAEIVGLNDGREIAFHKTYPVDFVSTPQGCKLLADYLLIDHGYRLSSPSKPEPMVYRGVLSDDGRMMMGSWIMRHRRVQVYNDEETLTFDLEGCYGSWSAVRGETTDAMTSDAMTDAIREGEPPQRQRGVMEL